MKKVLFATTALVMTAGVAAAEVTVGGDGRMGVVFDGDNYQFSSRLRIKFTASGETDNGLAFGGSVRADQANGGASGGWSGDTSSTKGTIYMSGAFGKLEMGDVVSAAEAALGDLSGVGYTGLNDFSDILYITGDGLVNEGPNALYSYSANGFGFFLSMSDGSDGYDATPKTHYSAAVSYSVEGQYLVALSYSDDGFGTQTTIGGSGTFGQTTVKAFYSYFKDYYLDAGWFGRDNGTPVSYQGAEMDQAYGLSVDYTFGATTLSAFYTREDFTAATDYNADTFGVGAAYDLGGGATVKGGIVDSDYMNDTIADVGVTFSF